MTSPDPPGIDHLVVVILISTWRDQVLRGHLNPAGLVALRGRLDPSSGEFRRPDPDLDLLLRDVEDALAAALGVPAEYLPGRPGIDHVPDTWSTDDPPA